MSTKIPGHSARLPFVFVNMAMSADGKIATSSREVSSFGSPRDQAHLFELRARADAVMCGARTVNTEGTLLSPGAAKYRRLRQRHGLAEYNLRIIVSGSGSVNPEASIFQQRFSPILILTTQRASRSRLQALDKLADDTIVCGEHDLDFREALRKLRARWGINNLLAEGGGELNDALFHAGVVNELHLTICPYVFGGRQAPTIAEGVGWSALMSAMPMKLISRKRLGAELFLVFRR